MENLIFTVNAILPIFLTMALGFFLKQIGFLKKDFLDQLNRFVFYIGTSALLFADTSKANFRQIFDGQFVLYILSMVLLTVVLWWVIVPRFEKDRVKAGTLIHCGYRSNFAILGLPLAKNLLDVAGVGKTAMVLAFGVPLFNVIAVVCLSYWSGTKGDYKSVAKKIVTNPLVIGALSGLLLAVFDLRLPKAIDTSISYLANTTMGLGLILLGGSFDIKKFIENFHMTIFGSLLKVVFAPILMLTVTLLLGYRGDEAVIAFIFSGAPTAISSYAMAKEMGSDSELTSGIIICSTGLCIITLFVGIYLMRTFGIF